jgi:hypothetical protein
VLCACTASAAPINALLNRIRGRVIEYLPRDR